MTHLDGTVCALWVTYALPQLLRSGLPIELVRNVIEKLKIGETPRLLTFSADLCSISMSSMRNAGLPDEWVCKLETSTVERHSALTVSSTVAGSELAPKNQASNTVEPLLKNGDALLEVNGQVVTRFHDIAALLEKTASDTCQPIWSCMIMRDGKVMPLAVPLTPIQFPSPVTPMVGWAGAILQAPFKAVLEQVKEIPNGPYISYVSYGSPGEFYGLRSGVWVTEINGEPVADLDDFWRIVQKIEASEFAARQRSHMNAKDGNHDEPLFWDTQPYVRLKTVNRLQGARVLTLRTDEHYKPTFSINMNNERGVRFLRSSPDKGTHI